MRLSGQLTGAWLAEGGAGSRCGNGQEVVEVAPAHQEQAVGGPRTGHGQAPERRVELVEHRRAGVSNWS